MQIGNINDKGLKIHHIGNAVGELKFKKEEEYEEFEPKGFD